MHGPFLRAPSRVLLLFSGGTLALVVGIILEMELKADWREEGEVMLKTVMVLGGGTIGRRREEEASVLWND